MYFKAAYYSNNPETSSGLVGVVLDITDRKRYEKLQDVIYRISEAANTSTDIHALFTFVHQVVNELISAKNLYIALVHRIGKYQKHCFRNDISTQH